MVMAIGAAKAGDWAAVEADARAVVEVAHGAPVKLILETGLAQPEAIELYRTAGYVDIPAFGFYAEEELSVHLGKIL